MNTDPIFMTNAELEDQKAQSCVEAFRPFQQLKDMQVPDNLIQYAAEVLALENRAASIKALWATNLGLVPVRDGNQWIVLYGENLQVGIAASGNSPEDAMFAFETVFRKSV